MALQRSRHTSGFNICALSACGSTPTRELCILAHVAHQQCLQSADLQNVSSSISVRRHIDTLRCHIDTLRVCVQVGSLANCMTLCAKDADQQMADSGGAVLACVLYGSYSMCGLYCTHLLQRYCPPMASMAASEASNPSKLTKPKPLLAPVSGSRMILGVAITMPKALKVSYRSCIKPMARLSTTWITGDSVQMVIRLWDASCKAHQT